MTDNKKKSRDLKDLADDATSPQFLDALIKEAAAECDALGRQRILAEEDGALETSQLSTRRVQSIKLLTEMYFTRTKNRQRIDIKSPEMEIVIKSILERVKNTLKTLELDTGRMKIFFKNLDGEMAGWEEDVSDQLEAYRSRDSVH